ncbi:Octanoyltransferase [Penicillium malachiteum]|uniref:Octanoyltransferase n=1 Tax=Penicillium malachiteum TaxID=1324776 RepID=A0AAD6HAB6_9EURO|nr:Octanoyltransferase [Penicillium malachiteum]
MRLAHLHLPHTTPFARVSELQQALTTRFLTHKKARRVNIFSNRAYIYTTGRRDLPPSNTCSLSTSNLSLPPPLEPIRALLTPSGPNNVPMAEYHPTLRGGQTTYHGPGQMVAYTILDLRRLGLTPRCHIRVLENSVIDVLKQYGVKGFTTEDPGVWVQDGPAAKKITAVGVHLRRNISSFGVGLNVTNEPMWFLKQIVACGLEGKEATSLEGAGVSGVTVDEVANNFVERFVERVNRDFAPEKIKEVYPVQEDDLLHG